jgi:hypothetical protein
LHNSNPAGRGSREHADPLHELIAAGKFNNQKKKGAPGCILRSRRASLRDLGMLPDIHIKRILQLPDCCK